MRPRRDALLAALRRVRRRRGSRSRGRRRRSGRPGRRSADRARAPTHAYVKVSDGCDRRCAYCAIPLIKGDYEAVAPRAVLAAARRPPSRAAPASWCSSARTRRAGRGRDGAGWSACWRSSRRSAPPGCACSTCSPTASTTPCSRRSPRTPCRTSTCRSSTPRGAVLRRMGRAGDGDAYLALLDRVRAAPSRAPPSARRSSPASRARPRPTSTSCSPSSPPRARRRRRLRLRPPGGDARRRAAGPGPAAEVRLERAARARRGHRRAPPRATGSASSGARSTCSSSAAAGAPTARRWAPRRAGARCRRAHRSSPAVRLRRGQIVRARVVGTLGYDVTATTAG